MSVIKKMSIQGIRSFGPDDDDKQTIHFFKPLTVIQGPNGSGKTTVIECLKFITTGTLPPGLKGGGAFIHDPKIMRKKEIVGQVKLKLKDVSGEPYIVEKVTKATLKGNKIETKTVDCAITKTISGVRQDMTSKCANLYKEMITLLGVSKPVLDNVIFCHQEDSNWPLSDGKLLKERFDAIFASTRYAKALDVIRKLKQEQDMKVREIKATLTTLQINKERAAQLKDEISAREERLAASKQMDQEVEKQLVPLKTRLAEIDKELNEINKIQTQILKHQSVLQEKENSMEEIKKSIKKNYKGKDLKQELDEIQDQIRKMTETIEKDEQKERKLSQELEKLGKKESNLKLEVGKLEQEAEGNTEKIRKRDTLIRQCADKYKFDGFGSDDITETKCETFIGTINNKLETLNSGGETLKAEYEKKEEDQQKKIDELRDTKTKLEQREKMKRDIVEANRIKIIQIDQKRCEVDTSAHTLYQLKQELRKQEEVLQTVKKTVNAEAINKEISDLTEEKVKLESKISQLSREMNTIHHQSSEQAHLQFLEKEKSTRQEKFYRLQVKHEDFISSLLPETQSGNMTEEFDKYIRIQNEEISKVDADLHEIKISLTKKEAEKEIIMKELNKEEAELKALKQQIFSIAGSHNFDEGLQKIQQQLSQSQDQKSSLLGEDLFFKSCTRDFNKNDPCCPLCHQKFDKDDDVNKLILELGNKSDMISAKFQEAQRHVDEFQNKYDDMMQLKPMRILKAKEIPQLKINKKKTSEEIDQLKFKIQHLEDTLKAKEKNFAAVKLLQHDINMMGFYYEELQELDARIKSSKLAGGDSFTILQELINEMETLQKEVDSLTHQLSFKWQKLNDHMDKVQNLSTSISYLREKILDIEIELQQNKLEEDKTTLLKDNEVLTLEIEKAATELKPLQKEIDSLRQKKDNLTKVKEEECDKVKSEINTLKTEAIKVKDLNKEIKCYVQSGKAGMLKQRRASIEDIQGKLARTSEIKKVKQTSLDKLRKDLPSRQMREQDLQRNFNLRKKKKEIKDIKTQIDKLEKKSSAYDKPKLEMERAKHAKQTSDLDKELNVAKGRQMGFLEEIRKMKKDIQLDMYANAEEKFRDMMIDLRTTEMVSKDLKKYFDALDISIMKYHKLKMEEINSIIRELWRNTYRGNDIETIEICSDVDNEDDKLNPCANPRKTYNYRVVMVKGDTKLDMRGRCSAGQKVLASLIIRLALAETFCLNCGILALDEPTANLDHENTESLAHALVDIIKNRSHHRNFQLLVITHNEDFVDLLGRSDYVEEVYKVCKNQDGYSQLIRSKVCEDSLSMTDTQMRSTQRMTDTQMRDTQRMTDTQMQGTQRMSDTTQMQGTQRMTDTQMRGTQRMTDTQMRDTQRMTDTQMRGTQRMSDTAQMQDTQRMSDTQMRGTQRMSDTTQMQGTQRMTDSQTTGTQMMTDNVIVID